MLFAGSRQAASSPDSITASEIQPAKHCDGSPKPNRGRRLSLMHTSLSINGRTQVRGLYYPETLYIGNASDVKDACNRFLESRHIPTRNDQGIAFAQGQGRRSFCRKGRLIE